MEIPSKYLEHAVEQIASLPGIGKKSAMRITLQLLKRSELEISDFASAIINLKINIKECNSCGNVSDEELCTICSNEKRDHTIICVVEDIRDVMAIESTGTYKGIYHVLSGLISPMEGISPNDLNIKSLIKKAETDVISEIIFALSPTMEGDTTNYYLYKKLQHTQVYISSLSRGIAVGSELQYADELTLGRSLQQRQPFQIQNK